jgi:uncharacterized membrane protein YfcA
MTIAFGLGAIAGLFSGLLGVGGGTIVIPGLVLLLDTNQHVAQGISLTAMLLTALVGAFIHYRQKNVRVSMALFIAPSAVAFTYLGAWAAGIVTAEWLTRLFAICLLAIGCWLLFFSRGGQGVSTS